MATASGRNVTGTVSTTVLLAVAITVTLLEFKFVTYTCFPSGVTATPWGPIPAGTVATTVGGLVAVSITETLLSPKFDT
jgi:hypothetical protein